VGSDVSQQLSIKAAGHDLQSLRCAHAGKKFPTPREIVKMPTAKMRTCGLSGMKVAFMKDLAKKTLDALAQFQNNRHIERRRE